MIKNFTGTSGSRTAWMIAQETEDKVLAVVSSGRTAERLAGDLSFFAPEAEIIVMPEEDDIQILYEARNRESQVQRIRGIDALCSGVHGTDRSSGSGQRSSIVSSESGSGQRSTVTARKTFVIAPVSAAVRLMAAPVRYTSSVIELSMGDVIEPADLRDLLVSAGYTSAPVTESPGEFTSRGGILDVFPPALSNPLRIEFFDDEIDSIRSYDPDTQRSLENVPHAVIGPAAEFIPSEEEKLKALERIRREYDRRIRKAKSEYTKSSVFDDQADGSAASRTPADGQPSDNAASGLAGSHTADSALIDDQDAGDAANDIEIHNRIKDGRIESLEMHKGRVTDLFEHGANVQIYSDFIEYFDTDKARLWDYAAAGGAAIAVIDPARLEDELPESVSKDEWRAIYLCGQAPASSTNAGGTHTETTIFVYTPYPEMIRGIERMDEIVNVRSRQMAPFNGQIDLFAAETGKLSSSGYSITIVSSTDERAERIREYLAVADVEAGVTYRTGSLSSGFIMDDSKVCFITESDIYPENHRRARKPKKKKKSSDTIEFSDLHKGDYIVHEAHGIGRFEGIQPVTADGQTRDYLVIRYAGSDVLYIPTEQLDIIQKYIGNSGNPPALSRLSGGSWKRQRERARKAIEAIAEDLVRLYAERQAAGGYAFGKDTVWQSEFEEYFPYTETDDQLRAVEEIKEDMEKPLPMDRLLCGDVGYGKTEVAARAIFKCVSEGKQAALLAPTTLLVNQHYHNLKERFAHFPFEIQELSRFRSAQAQKKTAKAVKGGEVDLIIGTHRLLSDDVKFRDLGLLVIDEEQRFGVRHKEKLKQLKQNVDVLTLSATPIPRTLNMSLTGIKDISIIDEPPGDRLPVHTYVTPYEEEILRNAIERELARGGQVFVVNNRITGLNQIRETIERLVPDAVTAVGHGRMSEETLENTMLDFVEGRTNVLIATTIIENGIDIPNANTMIILNADRFGLAQLYQLRGRVGRSHRLAYAYLMYQPGKVLTEIARKRLTAIREFTEFGAGFKLAMRDLELRGAGNMLGEAQSGHIESIGYELYCKEIDRAVRRLKGEVVTDQRSDITIDIPVQASVPESYITDETLRLQAYRKIAGISCREDAEDLADELTDRYGDVPQDTMNLLKVAEVRAHAEIAGVSMITRRGPRIEVKFAENTRFSAYAAVMTKAEFGDALTIMSGRTSGLSLYAGNQLHTKSVSRQAAAAEADLDKVLALMRTLRYAIDAEAAAQE